MIKIGLIGCGNISKFHIPAFQKAGFAITAISGRDNSNEKLSKFSLENKLTKAKIFSNSFELIKSNIWDALLICCPTENSLEYLKIASDFKKPILVEKPITHNSSALLPLLKYKNIKVSFNRRFYKSVKFAKKFYDTNNISLVKVSIPERNNDKILSGKFPSLIYENSIHIFDLLKFILGDYKFHYCKSLIENNTYKIIIASGMSVKRSLIQLDICLNSSDNFSIDIISDTKRVELCPIEVAKLYDGIETVEPSKKMPIRRYNPIIQKEVVAGINDLKPGFYEQALDFKMFCKGKLHKGSSIKDAYNNLKSIEQLFKLQKN